MMKVPHHECEAAPTAPIGSLMPPPIGACVMFTLRSDSHSQPMIDAIAMKPQMKASTIAFTVSSRKKPAVPAAPITVSQLSPGRIIR